MMKSERRETCGPLAKRLFGIAAVLLAVAGTEGAALGGTFTTNFANGLPSNTAVYGTATVFGPLYLTAAKQNQEGALVIADLDDGSAVQGFDATFKMYIGGGNGADGLSFNFGDLPDTAFGEDGAGNGLRVLFDTFDDCAAGDQGCNDAANEIEVDYGGERLLVSGTVVLRNTQITIGVNVSPIPGVPNAANLTVNYNGATKIFGPLVDWAPQGGWKFGFGARTGSHYDAHEISSINITTTAGAAPTPVPTVGACVAAGSPGYTSICGATDVLNGQRVLADVADLVVADPVSENLQNVILATSDGGITGESTRKLGTGGCYYAPQQVRAARLFNQANDVAVTVAATTSTTGSCSSVPQLSVYVHDTLEEANDTTTTLPLSAAGVAAAVADFDYDGYDDVLVLTNTQAMVATAVDVNTASAGVDFGPVTTTTSARSIVNQPVVADFNADGLLDVAWVSGTATNGANASVYFATVCPGARENTVCAQKEKFQVVLNPLSSRAISVPECAATGLNAAVPAPVAGHFTGTSASELLVGYVSSSCTAVVADLYQFDGSLVATRTQQLTLQSQATLGPSTVYGRAAALDWFAGTDQAAFVFAGTYSQGTINTFHQVAVVSAPGGTLKSSLAALVLTSGNQTVGGIATGLFGPPAGGYATSSSFTPQIAVLLVGNPNQGSKTYVEVYDVNTSTKPISASEVSQHTVASYALSADAAMANVYGNQIEAADLQGRSVRVGEPEVIQVSQSSQPQIILGMPPMHVDYVQPQSSTWSGATVVNFSAVPSAFQSMYATAQSDENQSSNESTTSYTEAVKVSSSETGKAPVFTLPLSAEVDVTDTVGETYQNSVATQYDSYSSVDFNASTATGFGDQIWFTTQRFNIYAYPVIGQTSCPVDQPACTAPSPTYVMFSGPDEVFQETINGSTVEWYQPITEPGQIFSYPWSLAQLEARVSNAQLLSSATPTGFFTDNSQHTVNVNWSESNGSSVSTGTASTHSFDHTTSLSVGTPDLDSAPLGANRTTELDYGNSTALTTLAVNTSTLGSSTGISITKPISFLTPGLYQYLVVPYIFGQALPSGTLQSIDVGTDVETTGVLQVGFVADPTDAQAGSWWKAGAYSKYPDIALNHPARWTVTPYYYGLTPACLTFDAYTTQNCATINAPDASDLWNSEFYWMRGLYVTVGGTAGPQRTQATAGDDVVLQARVYNYSLKAMSAGSTVHARFYRQQWDPTDNTPIGDSILIGENSLSAIPPFNGATTTTSPNWVLATTSFDSTGLDDTYWIFWVVVWGQDASGNLLGELPGHGLTSIPDELTSIGDVPLETLDYTDDISGVTSTTSFSNNVGFLKQAFYVAQGTAATAAGLQAAELRQERPQAALAIEDFLATKARVRFGEKLHVRAHVRSGGADSDGVLTIFYDGDPESGGTAFDMEMTPRIGRDRFAEVRVPFRSSTCGQHAIVVVAAPGRPNKTRSSTSVEVTDCILTPTPVSTPTPTPSAATSRGVDDDGCNVGRGTGRPAWSVFIPALLLWCARRRRS